MWWEDFRAKGFLHTGNNGKIHNIDLRDIQLAVVTEGYA